MSLLPRFGAHDDGFQGLGFRVCDLMGRVSRPGVSFSRALGSGAIHQDADALGELGCRAGPAPDWPDIGGSHV